MLYKKDSKGKMRFWNAYAEDGSVFVEHGTVGGKSVSSSYKSIPTNKGRSNARDSVEQAMFEVESLYNKKRDSGYFGTIEQAESEQLIRPMLAHVYQDHKNKLGAYVYVQPKLNGVRCLAFPDGTLMSRKGKVYKVPNVSEVIKNMWHCDGLIAFDGELYIHGKSLGDIQGAAKTGGLLEDGTNLEFHVYDIVHKEMVTQERIEQIRKLQGFSDYFRIVGNAFIPIKHEEFIEQFHDYFTGLGYEGIMLRNPNSLYEIGKQSYSLLKYKKFKDAEFVITGVYKDRFNNAMFTVWDDEINANQDVKYGTHSFGRDCLDGKINVIGMKMTVKYQSRFVDTNRMEFPVGVNIRDDYS